MLFQLLAVGSAEAAPPSSCISGRITDAESDEEINWATVSILELERTEPSHDGGAFTFCKLPEGTYTLSIEHVGYRAFHMNVTVLPMDTVFIEVVLHPTTLQTEEVVVTAKRSGTGLERTSTTQSLSGANLQQQLGGTLAETIEDEPGIAKQSMGPATARPVIRGLSGDRLVILEDGTNTGDASAISTDHAVTADPMTAERIDILRGPASLLYSSNALGGVINIERQKTITNRPDRIHGTISLQGASVSNGYSIGTSLGVPAGPFGLQLQTSYRNAGSISTPEGELQNTMVETFDGSTGVNWLFAQGSAGASGSYYQTEYGIPGGFTGAHPDGVRITMDRSEANGNVDYHIPDHFLQRVRINADYTRYHHKEIESGGIIGTEFGILTSTASARLYHDSIRNWTDHGILSIQGNATNFVANGVGIPETNERSIGIALFEEKQLDMLSIATALRYDFHQTLPVRADSSDVGIIEDKTFADFSGSLSVNWSITDALSLGVTATRTFRNPTVEELFSDGPHLAAYNYEIGNADLTPEKGVSLEAITQYTAKAGQIELALYRNAIDNYVFPRATGDTNYRTLLPIYQYTGEEALFVGGELTVEWQLLDRLTGTGGLSYVHGERQASGLPLPFIPPLKGNVGLRWQSTVFLAGITARGAASQDYVGEFETPTDGYITLDATAQYRIISESVLHTIIVGLDNILDTSYRNHLSRTKEIMAEPGRNMRLLYRLYF